MRGTEALLRLLRGDPTVAGKGEWESGWQFPREDKEPEHELVFGLGPAGTADGVGRTLRGSASSLVTLVRGSAAGRTGLPRCPSPASKGTAPRT